MKRIITILTLSIATSVVIAQHEFTFGGGAGVSALNFDVQRSGFGGSFGFGYLYRFGNRWSIRTGANIDLFNTTFSGNRAETNPIGREWHYVPLPPNYNILHTATMNGINERSQVYYLQIPLMLQYIHRPFERRSRHTSSFYWATGFKFGIPLSSSYEVTIDEVITTGYNEFSHQSFIDRPLEGFSTYQDLTDDGRNNFRFDVFFALEVGMAWRLSDNLKLYTGLYINQSLSRFVSGNNATTHVQYNGGNPPKLNATTTLSNQAGITTVGISLRLSIIR